MALSSLSASLFLLLDDADLVAGRFDDDALDLVFCRVEEDALDLVFG